LRKPEQKLWDKVHQYFPGDVSRVENVVDSGMPDVTAAYINDYWVELKVEDIQAEKGNILKILRPSQLVWHARRVKQCSIIFVLIEYIDYIILYQCIAPSKYEGLLALPRDGRTFDYQKLNKEIVDNVKEKIWF
jgi:hypothetical protein